MAWGFVAGKAWLHCHTCRQTYHGHPVSEAWIGKCVCREDCGVSCCFYAPDESFDVPAVPQFRMSDA